MRPLAITLGDPAGIGPEVVLRALRNGAAGDRDVVLFGSRALTEMTSSELGLPFPATAARGQAFALVDVDDDATSRLPRFGTVDAEYGSIALRSIERAVSAIQSGMCDGLVTAPIHKAAIAAAGSRFPGHTELLAQLTGRERYGRDYAMYFESPELRVVLLTVHLSLAAAIRQVGAELVHDLAMLTDRELLRLHGKKPRIGVAGLNPHAGEGGLFGNEESVILRGITEARAKGVDIDGPFAADTLFHAARRGRYDVVMAMYHDQGLIPIKTLDFEHAVNVTLGLPFLRASVDHGTAFDIAGQGIADAAPMEWAIRWTVERTGRGGA
jgi:4-hydroxythreonine-4-phosphate dehydrogenase